MHTLQRAHADLVKQGDLLVGRVLHMLDACPVKAAQPLACEEVGIFPDDRRPRKHFPHAERHFLLAEIVDVAVPRQTGDAVSPEKEHSVAHGKDIHDGARTRQQVKISRIVLAVLLPAAEVQRLGVVDARPDCAEEPLMMQRERRRRGRGRKGDDAVCRVGKVVEVTVSDGEKARRALRLDERD